MQSTCTGRGVRRAGIASRAAPRLLVLAAIAVGFLLASAAAAFLLASAATARVLPVIAVSVPQAVTLRSMQGVQSEIEAARTKLQHDRDRTRSRPVGTTENHF